MFEPERPAPTTETQQTLPLPSNEASTYPFRLLDDEAVLATYPITNKKRPLGKLVSYLFVTDSRVIYAAESKSVLASSTELKTFRLDRVDGLEAGRRRGLNALGAGISVAIVLNILFLAVIGALFTTATSSYSYSAGGSDSAGGFAAIFTIATITAFVIGAAVIANLARPSIHLSINAQASVPWALAQQRDWLTIGVVIFLFIVFGPLIGVALLAWMGVRALGLFQAEDAFFYADTENLDAISYDAGAVITDAQARGAFAGS